MQDNEEGQRGAWRWALPVSVATHLAAVALLVLGLPQLASNPAQEQTINVELVPPPGKPPKKPKPPEPPPEAPRPPEKQPEPPKPPPPPQEPAKAPEPPPQAPEPAPPKQAEATKPEPEQPAAARAPLPVLQPVVQFGDRDSGPRKALDGDSADDGETTPADKPDPKPPDPAEAKDKSGKSGIALADAPNTRPAEPKQPGTDPKPAKAVPRTKAKTLFSRAMTSDPQAMTAMGKIPRDRRGGTLCGTELRAQLVNASPPHFPDMLPSVRLTSGTVIEVQAAFHAAGAWRSVSYRCQVDDKATKVVSFSLGIGDLIPRSEWSRRGLPAP